MWAVFVASGLFLLMQKIYIIYYLHVSFPVLSIETMGRTELHDTLTGWLASSPDGKTLLHYARVNTKVDLIYIVGYVSVLIMISYKLMQRERSQVINNLLRFCFLLVVLAGFLDLIEDLILLFDMYQFQPGKLIYSARYFAYLKWIAGLLVPLTWIVSLTGRLLKRKAV